MIKFTLWVRDSHFPYSPRSDKKFSVDAESYEQAVELYNKSGAYNRQVLKVLETQELGVSE